MSTRLMPSDDFDGQVTASQPAARDGGRAAMKTETREIPETIQEAARWCLVHRGPDGVSGLFHDCEYTGLDPLTPEKEAQMRAYVIWDLGPKWDHPEFEGERPVHIHGSTGLWGALLVEIDRLRATLEARTEEAVADAAMEVFIDAMQESSR